MSDWATIGDLWAEKDRQRAEYLEREIAREKRTYRMAEKCPCGRLKKKYEAVCFRCKGP